MQSDPKAHLETTIRKLNEAAELLRAQAATVRDESNLSEADRAAVHASLRSLSTRLESYSTYLEDCRIMLDQEAAEAAPF